MKKIKATLLQLYIDKNQLLFLTFLAFVSYLLESLISNNSNLSLAIAPMVALQGIGLASSIIGGKRQKRAARQNQAKMLEAQKEQQALLEKQKDEFRAMEFSNPYAGMENPYAENVYEDLTVNQQQAQFQSQQGAQQRANIMGGLRGAAGSSGIAGLAQAMANQGQLQAQQISASIGQQEAMNQKLRAQGEEKLQAIQLGEAKRVQSTLLGEQGRLQQADVQGQIYEFETKEGREMQELNRKQAQITGAAQAEASAAGAKAQAISSGTQALGSLAGGAMGG